MTKESERLVAFGFLKDKPPLVVYAGKRRITIKGKTPSEILASIKEEREKLSGTDLKAFKTGIEKLAAHEWVEVAKDQLVMTDYPNPINRYYMNLESWHNSIEPYYFWCINFLGDIGFPVVDKITDIFTAAEHSSFYGAGAQRLGLAQDKVGQYMATIGKMIKDLFQLVRELRWIDERLMLYRQAKGVDKEGNPTKEGPQVSAELAVKGLWVDMVDGVVQGQRTGSNLFVMAQQLQFTALPDIFFSTHVKTIEEIDKEVEKQAGEFNKQVKNALKRKLAQYIAWKESTWTEMQGRRRFTLDYMRQHYDSIRMYMNWVKPYLRHVQRLSGSQDLLNNPRLIAAFESSLVEIEVLARHRPEGSKDSYACVLLTFEYHTKPAMQFQGDQGYHRGPVHVGTTRITWRGYAWTEAQINNYLKMRRKEDLDMAVKIDASLQSAMDALGGDLEMYLEEAERKRPKEEKPPEKLPLKLLEPFSAVGQGMKDLFGETITSSLKDIFGKKIQKEKPNVAAAKSLCWLHYNIFKKAHGLLAW